MGGPDSTGGRARPGGRSRGGRRHRLLATLAVAPVALVAACCTSGSGGGGGGGSSSSPAYAPPTPGTGPNGSFSAIPGAPAGALQGQLLYYQPAPADAAALGGASAWQVAYVSTDAQGTPDVVTGTVAVPAAAWTGTGPRPVVDFAPGTQGLGQQCAPSQSVGSGLDYETPNLKDLLAAGYAVVMTDYQWAGTSDTPPGTYEVGLSEGHAVLDMADVGYQVPGSGLSPSAPVVVWGYSQGGGAATWAGQLWKSYAPAVPLVGIAAGGVPGNLVAVGAFLDGSQYAAFAADALVGFHDAYPDLPWAGLINSTGQTALATLESECELTQIATFGGQHISDYVVGNLSFQQLLQQEPQWVQAVDANSPGQAGATIPLPVYMYAAAADDVIPPAVENQVYADLCADNTVIQATTVPGTHIPGEFEAVPGVMAYLAARFGGTATPVNSCTADATSL